MALEFPEAAVLGLDLVPNVIKAVPPNCEFRIHDINHGLSEHYNTFDVVHMRSVAGGVSWLLLSGMHIPDVAIRL
jgi:hypothetical protein